MTFKSLSTSHSTLETFNSSSGKRVWFSRNEEVVTGGYDGKPLSVTFERREVPPTKRRGSRRPRRKVTGSEAPIHQFVQDLLAAQKKLRRKGAPQPEAAVLLARFAASRCKEDRLDAWEKARKDQACAMKIHQDTTSSAKRKLERTMSNDSNAPEKKSLMKLLFQRRQPTRVRQPVAMPIQVY